MARAQDGTSCKDRTYQGVCINGKCEVRLWKEIVQKPGV